ncbi:MAG: hypothetical protein JEY94_13270 [Melioribacteraceae bacterium]|nr:hypothetical protein [Melioribacteraceae bacterium]
MDSIKGVTSNIKFSGIIKPNNKEKLKDQEKNDSLNISNSANAFKKIDDFLNLGKPDRLNMDNLSDGEKEEFLKMLSTLLKEGIVGYEYLEVDGKKEKHFIVNQLKNDRIRGAKLWDKFRDEPYFERK